MLLLGFAETNRSASNAAPSAADADQAKSKVPAKPAADEELLEEEEVVVGDEVSAALATIAPWVISFILHAAAVLLAWFIAWTVVSIEMEDEEVIIPDIRLSENPGAKMSLTKSVRVDKSSSARRALTRVTTTNTLQNTEVELENNLIGAVGASASRANPFGTTGTGDSPGFFGVGGGDGGNVKRVAFLIDASGSLIDTMPFVIEELKSYVRKLKGAQSFTIIFFGRNTLLESPPRGLQPATGEYKDRTIDWLEENKDTVLGLKGEPVKAIQDAIGYNPQLIYILSDNITGQRQYAIEQDKLINEMKRLLKDKKVLFNTIQFVHDDPLVEQGKQRTLERIANEFGGRFKFLPGEELNIE